MTQRTDWGAWNIKTMENKIMDTYEKKYNDALERAKKLAHDNAWVTSIFPELKESEDERIRKWLIEMVEELRKTNPTNAEHNGNCSEAIAYLEKQKEQIVIKQNIIDSIRANTQPDWDFSTIPNLHKEINRFFGEKFVLPHTENTVITVSDVIRCAYHFYKFGQQEQKPAWSEEDEYMLNRIIETLSLPPVYDTKACEKMVSWLKSLRPQPHWKPSVEQVSILGKVFAGCELNTSERDSMVDLFYHLKDMI